MGALITFIIVGLLWTALVVRGFVGFRASPPLAAGEVAESALSVTAFVPARNEEEVIEATVEGLLAQGETIQEIVVIDDASTDTTRAKLSSYEGRVTILHGEGPGQGECGKPAALRNAIAERQPETEWLLFVDADVELAKNAVPALVAAAQQHDADLVSGFPKVVLESSIEKVAMPSVGALVVANHPPDKVAAPGQPAFANGQVILVKRAIYEKAGGHGAVVREILEDVRLAQRVKDAGGKIHIADLRNIASTRMYSSWTEMREGWAKNLFLLVHADTGRAITWMLLSLVLGWSGWASFATFALPWGLATLVVVVLAQSALRWLGGQSPLWAFTAPIGALITAYLLLRSMRLHLRGAAIPWKGRAY